VVRDYSFKRSEKNTISPVSENEYITSMKADVGDDSKRDSFQSLLEVGRCITFEHSKRPEASNFCNFVISSLKMQLNYSFL
jgi:hypothetical protein